MNPDQRQAQADHSTQSQDRVSGLTDEHFPVVVIGGGPAGLTGAYELLKLAPSTRPLVVESGQRVGGIARTEEYKGYRFDIGGHRFFTKVKPVEELWEEILGDDMIDVPRSSRIFYRGKYYDYPLSVSNALGNLGLYESARVALSFAKWKIFPSKEEENFEQWVSNRFGGRLYWHFFRTYTEKVWGIPPTEIRADWAAQRIKDLSLVKAVVDAITGRGDTASLIKTFKYPRLGPGQMWERAAEIAESRGGQVRLNTRAMRIHREGNRVTSVDMVNRAGESYSVRCDHLMNSMPITELVRCISPAAPQHVLDAADKLKYRDFLIVTLVLDHADPFDDNWIYIHSPDVKVGRIQNFRAWSQAMLPNQHTASIGMEYFCHEGDGLWTSTNEELLQLAKEELEKLGLAPASSVIDGTVIRQPKAYPVYDADYKANLDIIMEWLLTFENLQSVGRNGMHRYNNQDHSMLAAILAARNILGESHDIWTVNVERSYHEEFVVKNRNQESPEGSSGSGKSGGVNGGSPYSVVIPAHNAGQNLESVVQAVLDSTAIPTEVLIADDGSTDDAPERAAALHPSVQHVRVGETPAGPAAVRNHAANLTTQEIVVFVDADVRVRADTLGKLIDPIINETDTVASFGSYDDQPEASSTASIYANLRHHCVHQASPEQGQTFWSGLGAVRRDSFLSAGGFDASFRQPSIEDVELGVRLSKHGQIKVVHSAQAKHLKTWTPIGLWRTDIFKRVLPWARLSARHPELAASLNASSREKLSAFLVGLMLLSLVVLPWALASVGTAMALCAVAIPAGLWLFVNRKLVSLMYRRGGVSASFGGTLLHVAYYIYAVPIFLVASGWYKWARFLSRRPSSIVFAVAIGSAIIAMGSLAVVMCVTAGSDTQWLAEQLASLDRNANSPRYTLESLPAVQNRLLLIGIAVFGLASALVIAGPSAICNQLAAVLARCRETIRLPRNEAVLALVFTLIYAALGLMYINQQMRLDESSTFSMYATANPMVALSTYETPNNHILNSALMWLSVRTLGISEWSARLPAFMVSLFIPAGILIAGRSLLSPMIGMIASGLFVGSVIAVDLATNARGYPFMVVAFLGLLALLPSLRDMKPGSSAAAVFLGVMGCYAVPVMAFPLAVVYATLLFSGSKSGQTSRSHSAFIFRIGLITSALTALLYAPAWALRTGSGPLETLTRVARNKDNLDLFRIDELSYNLHAAWTLWTWPAPSLVAIAVFGLAAVGSWMWISRPGWPRALIAGLVAGTLGIYALTGLAPPPWWVFVWFIPVLCLLVATPLSYIAVIVSPRPAMAPIAAVICATFLVIVTISSDYPKGFPYWQGCRDAPLVADAVTNEFLSEAQLITRTQWYRQINFELEKRGFGRGVSTSHEWVSNPTKDFITHARSVEKTEKSLHFDTLAPDLQEQLELVDSDTIGNVVLDRYRVLPALQDEVTEHP